VSYLAPVPFAEADLSIGAGQPPAVCEEKNRFLGPGQATVGIEQEETRTRGFAAPGFSGCAFIEACATVGGGTRSVKPI
jgi:hypothetical protein